MKFFFYNQYDDCRTFDSFDECRKAAIEDGTVMKFRDNQGGEYFL